jgi:hypothetical protein
MASSKQSAVASLQSSVLRSQSSVFSLQLSAACMSIYQCLIDCLMEITLRVRKPQTYETYMSSNPQKKMIVLLHVSSIRPMK